MKVQISASNDRVSISADPTMSEAAMLVKAALRVPLQTAHDLVDSSVTLASNKLKVWAEKQINSGVVGEPRAICLKIITNPKGVAQQIANSMVQEKFKVKVPKEPNPDRVLNSYIPDSVESLNRIQQNKKLR